MNSDSPNTADTRAITKASSMTPDPTLIEQVARAVREARFVRTGRGKAYDPTLPLHETELNDARAAIAAYEATLQGSAALPSADEVGQLIEDVLFPLFGAGPYEALAAKIAAMRATTPTPETGLVEALIDALEPFSKALGNIADKDAKRWPDSETLEYSGAAEMLTWGDLRKARRVLSNVLPDEV